MTTQFECALNGVSLSGLDHRLCILDIREDAPKMRLPLSPVHGEGLRLLARVRESLTVHIRFVIHEENAAQRSQVFSSVCAWAQKGGVFTASIRPEKQLHVICCALPAHSAQDWTQALTLSFVTTHCPYWEDVTATQVSTGSTATLLIPGTAEFTPVSAVVINTGTEPITRLTLRCSDTQLFFEDIHLAANSIFTFMYSDGLPSAWGDGVNALSFRTPQSADLLLAPCGKSCTAFASADQPLQAVFSARGRYL